MTPAYVVAVTGQGIFAGALRPEWEEAARRIELTLNKSAARHGGGQGMESGGLGAPSR